MNIMEILSSIETILTAIIGLLIGYILFYNASYVNKKSFFSVAIGAFIFYAMLFDFPKQAIQERPVYMMIIDFLFLSLYAVFLIVEVVRIRLKKRKEKTN